jgi:hypothetical protein
MKTYINETELNNYPYAFMRSGILFLAIPEMDAEPWTRPATCEWLEFMTTHYHTATTIILSHQAIEDTTPADGAQDSYRGQQDQALVGEPVSAQSADQDVPARPQSHGGLVSGQREQRLQPSGTEVRARDGLRVSVPGDELDYRLQPRGCDGHFHDLSEVHHCEGVEAGRDAGKWCAGFDQTWCVETTFDPKAEDWYSFPFLIQDGETQQTDMKVLSANTTLQLIGTGPVELFYDTKFETKGIHTNENILGFDNDLTSKVVANTPGHDREGAAHDHVPS